MTASDDTYCLSKPSDDLAAVLRDAIMAARPDHRAIVDSARTLTYRDLLDVSTRFAARLDGSVGTVAIALPRSIEAIVVLVGCIFAGRAFMPVSPAGKLAAREMLQHGEVTLVIGPAGAPPEWAAGFPNLRGLDFVFDHTAGASSGATLSGSWHADTYKAAAREYFITTSGSAGKPKLVRGSSKALARYLRWQREEFSMSERDVVTHMAPPWFDFSFKETLGALVAGATVCVALDDELLTGSGTLTWISAVQPTVVCLLPSRLAALIEAMERSGAMPDLKICAWERLKFLLVSGEPFPRQLFLQWRRLVPQPTVVNLYGPTESTVIKLRQMLPPAAVVTTATVPVGSPIPGTSAQIAREADSSAGELYIISDDLAFGYASPHGDPARFDTSADGRPLLRTGDLARRLADGGIELLGRADRIVKRRGQKVSLGAIESAAAEMSGIARAAAVRFDQEDGFEKAVIVLFCASNTIDAGRVREIRKHLLDSLPLSNMPDKVIIQDELPTDERGKIDYAKLRASRMRKVQARSSAASVTENPAGSSHATGG